MLDYFGKPVSEGDVIMQAHEYGMYFYEVRRDPETTTLLHVVDLDRGENSVIYKRENHIVNLNGLFDGLVNKEEVLDHVRQSWKAASGR